MDESTHPSISSMEKLKGMPPRQVTLPSTVSHVNPKGDKGGYYKAHKDVTLDVAATDFININGGRVSCMTPNWVEITLPPPTGIADRRSDDRIYINRV